uniref:Uncharacterized protein n=1 Tax=Cajanus cajan TaxID=3821 RepID=A0A151UGE8_CAJCA
MEKVIFEVGDWVWHHLRNDRFPTQRNSKITLRAMVFSKFLRRLMTMHTS